MNLVGEIEELRPIDGFAFPVWASPGTEERALVIGQRVERAHAWFTGVLGFQPRVRLLALAPSDWDRLAGMPVFGFPHFIGDDTVVVGSVPAPFFAEIVDFWKPDLSEPTWRRLRDVYGDPPVVDGFSDLLAVHELGHLFHVQAGFWRPATWLPELFCNVGLEGYVAEVEPPGLEILETLPLATSEVSPERFAVRELNGMDQATRVGGPLNYAWFELRLHAAAKPIWEQAGRSAFRRLYERFRDGPEPDDPRRVLHEEVHPEYARVIDEWPA
jgi:hypothetical protein